MTEAQKQSQLRLLPSVDEVLSHLEQQGLGADLPRPVLVISARKAVDDTRQGILEDRFSEVKLEDIIQQAATYTEAFRCPSLRSVINVSGIVIHTNLGRSLLAREALDAVQEVASAYSTLEYSTATMARGSRHHHYEELLCILTGAEAALAVNNNAGAVLMILSCFAAGREAIVSRGELVEIGGSFRVPDIMRLSQAKMVEVGTTNKTHLLDYQSALSPDTALLLKVHRSNFRMIGFTEEVSIAELRQLANQAAEQRSVCSSEPCAFDELLVYEDQGSGVFVDLGSIAQGEFTVMESLRAGADLVSFSGDKLLGGPQAGIIVGKKAHIDILKSSPLARALRLDKMSLAALEATLRLYLNKEKALLVIPTLRMLAMPLEDVQEQAQQLCSMLEEMLALLGTPLNPPTSTPTPQTPPLAQLTVQEEAAQAGGGSLPESEIPSFAVSIEFLQGSALECERFLVSEWRTPIICRIKKGRLLADPRTLQSVDEMQEIVEAIKHYFVCKVLPLKQE
ncbi:MAG: L-seryl-tRNA(Sec) selenium transferase [Coriobacteriia bacterium]|nr:L-seryl-tRNA(Sec) selenium transferase [Coriobacteriia bacterium]